MLNNMKKAAMFGLDARIALAIFGALSVISGAALYGAIKKAKTIAAITEFTEIIKAIEAYRVDTGERIFTVNAGSTYGATSKLGQLVKNDLSVTGWKGPYLNYDLISSEDIKNNKYVMSIASFGNRAGYPYLSTGGPCDDSYGFCGIWLEVAPADSADYASAIDLFKAIDDHVDNGDGFKSGRVHFSQIGNNTTNLVVSSYAPKLLLKYVDFKKNY